MVPRAARRDFKTEETGSKPGTPRVVCGKIDRFHYPVGRAFTPAVPVCPTIPPLGRDRVRSMRRGGIYAARKTVRVAGVYGLPVVWFAL